MLKNTAVGLTIALSAVGLPKAVSDPSNDPSSSDAISTLDSAGDEISRLHLEIEKSSKTAISSDTSIDKSIASIDGTLASASFVGERSVLHARQDFQKGILEIEEKLRDLSISNKEAGKKLVELHKTFYQEQGLHFLKTLEGHENRLRNDLNKLPHLTDKHIEFYVAKWYIGMTIEAINEESLSRNDRKQFNKERLIILKEIDALTPDAKNFVEVCKAGKEVERGWKDNLFVDPKGPEISAMNYSPAFAQQCSDARAYAIGKAAWNAISTMLTAMAAKATNNAVIFENTTMMEANLFDNLTPGLNDKYTDPRADKMFWDACRFNDSLGKGSGKGRSDNNGKSSDGPGSAGRDVSTNSNGSSDSSKSRDGIKGQVTSDPNIGMTITVDRSAIPGGHDGAGVGVETGGGQGGYADGTGGR